MKTKIYEIQINGEKEWVCADTAIEALKAYSSITGITLTDFENDDDIVEVPQEKWSEMKILNIDESEEDLSIEMTFADYMEKEATSADIIATTNY